LRGYRALQAGDKRLLRASETHGFAVGHGVLADAKKRAFESRRDRWVHELPFQASVVSRADDRRAMPNEERGSRSIVIRGD